MPHPSAAPTVAEAGKRHPTSRHPPPELLALENYDNAIIAIDPRFRNLNIPRLAVENPSHMLEAYEHTDQLSEHIAVISGTEISIYLAKKGIR